MTGFVDRPSTEFRLLDADEPAYSRESTACECKAQGHLAGIWMMAHQCSPVTTLTKVGSPPCCVSTIPGCYEIGRSTPIWALVPYTSSRRADRLGPA